MVPPWICPCGALICLFIELLHSKNKKSRVEMLVQFISPVCLFSPPPTCLSLSSLPLASLSLSPQFVSSRPLPLASLSTPPTLPLSSQPLPLASLSRPLPTCLSLSSLPSSLSLFPSLSLLDPPTCLSLDSS